MSELRVQNLTMRFGGITAVSDLSFHVERGQIFSVIGPNGAGKTTVFNAITGIYPPTSGTILFGGEHGSRTLTPRVVAGIVAIGLLVGLLSLVVFSGVEQLWKSAIRKPFANPAVAFNSWTALSSASDYMLGKPGVFRSPTGETWDIVSRDGTTLLATLPTRDDAMTRRDELLANDSTVMAEYQQSRSQLLYAVLGGFFLGVIASAVVWSRSRRTPDVIAELGIARTFQNIRLFQSMTALENILVGMDRRLSRNVLAMAMRLPGYRHEEILAERDAVELLRFVGLNGVSSTLAKNLPYGDQRRLEIARALATKPRLLLLDEPAAGMNPSETVQLMELIRKIRDRGVTILLIEHHMKVVMGISHRVAVLDYGVKIAEGTPAEISKNPRVIEAYLGHDEVG